MMGYRMVLSAALVALAAGSAAAAPAVTQDDLEMRAGPGPGFSVIMTIPAGVTVNAGSCRAGWCEIAFRGTVGFVEHDELAFAGPGPTYAAGAFYDEAIVDRYYYDDSYAAPSVRFGVTTEERRVRDRRRVVTRGPSVEAGVAVEGQGAVAVDRRARVQRREATDGALRANVETRSRTDIRARGNVRGNINAGAETGTRGSVGAGARTTIEGGAGASVNTRGQTRSEGGANVRSGASGAATTGAAPMRQGREAPKQGGY